MDGEHGNVVGNDQETSTCNANRPVADDDANPVGDDQTAGSTEGNRPLVSAQDKNADETVLVDKTLHADKPNPSRSSEKDLLFDDDSDIIDNRDDRQFIDGISQTLHGRDGPNSSSNSFASGNVTGSPTKTAARARLPNTAGVIQKSTPKLKGRWAPTALEWQCFYELGQYLNNESAEEYARKHKHNIRKIHEYYDIDDDDDVEELIRRGLRTVGPSNNADPDPDFKDKDAKKPSGNKPRIIIEATKVTASGKKMSP